MANPLSTGQVAELLAQELGIPLAEGQVQVIVRNRPDISPPVIGRRRRWRPGDVEALRVYLLRTRCGELAR